ncbi:patatin-like phospholipase domain-containing protein 4 isoform X1 [Aotus nancymaae]|uniref:Patatin like phospholipase domain containing 4 n=2 Tax=Aotus nancymaae TaxID=37293 RepID=A0A2K5DZB0_AOTNA|nr:patatin-like phospholipase domain-containing protein 4 isoform X1 [Aotus nancymaae]
MVAPPPPCKTFQRVKRKDQMPLPTVILHLFLDNAAARMKHINLSFAACGFLGIYHLGAASALCKHGKKLLKDVKAFAGASAGSLVASVLLTAPEKIEECSQFTYKFAEETRRQSFGAVTPGYDFMARLRSGMELILPSDAHELAQNRLHVSISNTKTRENYLVSSFSSREDLIKVLLASSFVPIYAGLKPVEYKGQKWVDGGLTNSLPILPVGRTVTISPFSGRLDISPQDKGRLDLYVNITKQDIMLSLTNLERLNQALFPPSKRKMESLYQCGFDDTVTFLLKENWFE